MMFRFIALLLLGLSAFDANGLQEGEYVGAKVEDIRKEALALVQLTQHTQPGEEQRAIPGFLKFTCPATISSIQFIAADLQDSNSSLTFSVLSPIQQPRHLLRATEKDRRNINRDHLELVSQSMSGRNISLYHVNFSPPLDINKGDLLGIGEGGMALQYAYGIGPENYVLRGFNRHIRVYEYIRNPVLVRDLPLLALEEYNCGTCSSSCVTGQSVVSSDLEALLKINTNALVEAPYLANPPHTPRNTTISPLLRFTDDGTITKWSVRGHPDLYHPPQLEIWRRNKTQSGSVIYEPVQGVSTPILTSFNKHTYSLSQEIAFREGDILGVRYAGSKRMTVGEIELSSDASGSGSGDNPEVATHSRHKKGIIQISLSIDLDISDSDSRKEDQEVVEPIIPTKEMATEIHTEFEHSAFPQFSIPYNGLLQRWIFAAHLVQSLTTFTESLQLQVWRPQQNEMMKTFRLIHSTNISLSQGNMQGVNLGTWELTLDKPIPVNAGDILGFHQPPADFNMAQVAGTQVSAHKLSVLETYPYILTRLMSSGTGTMVPLMAAEIVQGAVPSVSPTATPTSVVDKEDQSMQSQNKTIIIAATVSGVVGGLLILGLILILLYVCRTLHLKTKKLQRSSLLQRRSSEASNVYLRSLSTSSADSENGVASPTTIKTFY